MIRKVAQCCAVITPSFFSKLICSWPYKSSARGRYEVAFVSSNSDMMTSSNEKIFSVIDPLWGKSTGHRWIPLTKASDAELIRFLRHYFFLQWPIKYARFCLLWIILFITQFITLTSYWARRHFSIHQPHDCLLNRIFRRRSKKTSKLCVTGLCVGNSPVTGEFPAQGASNAEIVSI